MSRQAESSALAAAPPGAAPARWTWSVLAAALAAGALLPQVVTSTLAITLLTQAVIGGILATAVGLLIRQAGLVSFGHAAFFGLAGYFIALPARHGLWPAEVSIVLAVAAPTLLAFLLGLVIVRIPGVAFSMLTLAIGQAFHEFALRAREITGGEDGFAISLPRALYGVPTEIFQRPQSMFVIAWVALVVILFGLHLLTRTRFGRVTAAIRENEERARFLGYQTVVPRALVFALSALIGAVAGTLFALYNAFVSPEMLHWSLSGSALIMAIVGGTKLLWGPALGGVVFFFFKDLAGDLTEHWPAMIGLTLIVVTVALPLGIGGALVRLLQRLRPAGGRTHG
ncbi:MAG: branched-chain amino acid ABC transporter permease [Burkholderiales bacterium]